MKLGQFHWKYLPKEISLFFLNSFFLLWIVHLREPIVPNLGNFCIFQVTSCFWKSQLPLLHFASRTYPVKFLVASSTYVIVVLSQGSSQLLCFLDWFSMYFPVWTGFVSQGSSPRPPEKRGTCSRHAAKGLYFQINKKRKKKKTNPKPPWRNHKPVSCKLCEKENSSFRGGWSKPWLLVVASFSMGGKYYLSFSHK